MHFITKSDWLERIRVKNWQNASKRSACFKIKYCTQQAQKRVKLDFLEAQLRQFEQLDMGTPRGKSRLSANHQGCVID